jgi:hypothetical protein
MIAVNGNAGTQTSGTRTEWRRGNAFSNQIFSPGIHRRIDLVFMINGDKVRQMTTMARSQNKVNCTKPIPS